MAVFIDIHVHTRLFPGPERLEGGAFATPEQLMDMLKPHGVRKAVILPVVNPEGANIPQGMGEVEIISVFPAWPKAWDTSFCLPARTAGGSE